MPTVQTKQLGHNWVITLDPVGDDVDMSADVTGVQLTGVTRNLLDANAIGYEVMRQVHGAWTLDAVFTLQQRANWGLEAVLRDYMQGDPPFWMSWEMYSNTASVSASNQKLHLVNGVCGNFPLANVAFNTIGEVQLNVRFENFGFNDADDAAFVSGLDNSTAVTHIADAAPA